MENVAEMPAFEPDSATPETPNPAHKPRKAKEVCRPLNELMDANPKTMTVKEAAMVITQLRDDFCLAQNKLHEATLTAQKAFEQYRTANDNYQGLLQEYNARMRQIEDMSRVFNLSIKMMTGGAR